MKQKFDYNKNKDEFTKEMLKDTLKYQNQYGFDIGQNNIAWNNEADAFRHAYMQSLLNQKYGPLKAKLGSTAHEWKGRMSGQNLREYNMDMWNNQQGQEIYNEIRREYPGFGNLPKQLQKDIVAQKVVQRMKDGKLITDLNDQRKFQKQKPSFTLAPWFGGVQNNGKPLGFASNVNDTNQPNFAGYTNPLTGDNRIFTREDVGEMSGDEFKQNEKEINAQLKVFKGTMPSNSDLHHEFINGGGLVYVKPYIRQDGVQIRGHYRSR